MRVSSEPGFSEIKLIWPVSCIFHSPLSFLSFIKAFKYGFIKLRYSSKFNESLPSLLYSKELYSNNYYYQNQTLLILAHNLLY